MVWVLLLCFLQWALVFPHELGHAIAARLLGYTKVRVVIGAGNPVGSFQFAGLACLINRIPFGGVTVAVPKLPVVRWKEITFVASGLAVNLSCLLSAWWLMEPGALFDGRRTGLEAFFWANVIVITENLLPYSAHSAFGRTANDGKLLYEAIFCWNKPAKRKECPNWLLFVTRLVKALTLLLLIAAAICSAAVACLVVAFLSDEEPHVPQAPAKVLVTQLVAVAVLGGLSALSVSMAWRIYKSKVSPAWAPADQARDNYAWVRNLYGRFPPADRECHANISRSYADENYGDACAQAEEALRRHPSDPVFLYQRAASLVGLEKYELAETAWGQFLSALPAEESRIRQGGWAEKLGSVMMQGKLSQFPALIDYYLELAGTIPEKLVALDYLACIPLIHDRRDLLELGELCVRRALQIAPGQLTLRGTLGAILAESGRLDEAEPGLRECYERSIAMHDKGITAFYLALIAESQGDSNTAAALVRESLILYPEPWLVAKASALRKRLRPPADALEESSP